MLFDWILYLFIKMFIYTKCIYLLVFLIYIINNITITDRYHYIKSLIIECLKYLRKA